MSITTPFDIKLGVYRLLDNREEGFDDRSPRALALHNLRREALHEALDRVPEWKVTNWDVTDDSVPHEHTELTLAIFSNPHVQAAVVSAITWVGLELAKSSLSKIASDTVSAILSRLIPKQKEKKILEFTITLPDGTIIRCDRDSKCSI
jgi:hypothetical protein